LLKIFLISTGLLCQPFLAEPVNSMPVYQHYIVKYRPQWRRSLQKVAVDFLSPARATNGDFIDFDFDASVDGALQTRYT